MKTTVNNAVVRTVSINALGQTIETEMPVIHPCDTGKEGIALAQERHEAEVTLSELDAMQRAAMPDDLMRGDCYETDTRALGQWLASLDYGAN